MGNKIDLLKYMNEKFEMKWGGEREYGVMLLKYKLYIIKDNGDYKIIKLKKCDAYFDLDSYVEDLLEKNKTEKHKIVKILVKQKGILGTGNFEDEPHYCGELRPEIDYPDHLKN